MSDDYGVLTEPRTLRVERLLPGPIERLWAYLTDPKKRAKWLAGGPMELRIGGRAELKFRHADLSAEKLPPERFRSMEGGHTLKCRITACDPPRLLSYTWGEDWGEVTFELSPRGKDVLLVVTHRRLGDRGTLASVSAGWHTHLAILADRLNGREPQGFWSTYMRLEAQYEKRLGGVAPSPGGSPVAKAEMLIRKPVDEVFAAFVDPAITSQFWFTRGSGRLEPGAQVEWHWDMYGFSMPVAVKTVDPSKRIVVEWGTGPEATTIEWTFTTPLKDGTTFVSIVNSGFAGGPEAATQRALDATEGFAFVLAGLKALLEHNVRLNLVADRFPAGLEKP